MNPSQKSITEVANLVVIPDQSEAFISNFKLAARLISRQSGYRSHRLIRHLQVENRFMLIVEWDSVEAHQKGFRLSKDYQEWKALLHHFYDPFPMVEYFQDV